MPDKEGFENTATAIITGVSKHIKWYMLPSVCEMCHQPIMHHYDLVLVDILAEVSMETVSTIINVLKNVAREIYMIDIKVVIKDEVRH